MSKETQSHSALENKGRNTSRHLAKRYASEQRFIWYTRVAILLALSALVVLLFAICSRGYTAFVQTEIATTVFFDELKIDPDGNRDSAVLKRANYTGLIKTALYKQFPDAETRQQKRALYKLIGSSMGLELRKMILADPSLIGTSQRIWFTASDDVDMAVKGKMPRDVPETQRRLSDQQLSWLETLESADQIRTVFNTMFLTTGDSREPELAGIWGAMVGSFWMMVVCIALSVPFGVMTAIYLEEFAPSNKFTDLIEVNINNLAAVPSIIFGLLGLAMFLSLFGLPRSAPLVGGMVLALMTLPTVIIAARASLKAVPPSIREGALGIGASQMQTVLHHVLPLAVPGILTGTIIGMARALGESAPLLMIGMVAFIVDVPSGPLDASTALPVQVYLWSDNPERAFIEKTSAAIMVLLAFLITMNGAAVYLRRKFERRW